MGMSGRDSTTARVAVGRAPAGSATCTDWVPPGPRMMGPLGCAPGARAAMRGGGGGAGLAATFGTPAGTLETWLCWAGFTGSGRAGAAGGGGTNTGAAETAGSGFCSGSGAGATAWAGGAAAGGGATTGSGGRAGSGRISGAGAGGSARTSTTGGGGGGGGSKCSPSGCPSGPSVSAFLRRSTTPLAGGLGAAALGERSPRNFSVTARA